MSMYRILRRVDKGGPMGGLCNFGWLTENQIERLIATGAIAPVQAPPLSVLPGWVRRSQRLAGLGVEQADVFLETDAASLAAGLDVKPATVERWQREVAQLLTVPPRKRGRRER